MSAKTDSTLRLLAWRHANAIKAKVPYNSQSLIKFTPSYAFTVSWNGPEERKGLRDSPHPAITPPYFMTANRYGDPWAYVFVTSEKPVVEADIHPDAQAEVAMLWSDSRVRDTHFRYWKRGRLAVMLHAHGTSDADPIDIQSFTSPKHAKHAFRYDRNLGEALDTVVAPLGLNRTVGPPLTLSQGTFCLVGDPADYDSITLTALNPIEEGESPASDRLRDAINDGNVQAALQAIADGANLHHVSRMRTSPLEFACFCGNDSMVQALGKAGCPLNKDGPVIAESVIHFNPELKVLRTIETLARMGCSVNVADSHGMTALHKAVHAKFPTVVRRLVELGANKNARESALGRTPLELARELGDSPQVAAIKSVLSES